MAGKYCSTEMDRAKAAFKQDATFGRVKSYAKGGKVKGPGGPTDDAIDAKLSAGEYVLPADTTAAIGVENLDAVRDATHTPTAQKKQFGMAHGGLVWGRPGEIENRRAQGPSTMYQEMTKNAYTPAHNIGSTTQSVYGATPIAPPEPELELTNKQPQQQQPFGRRRRQTNEGWVYENGRIAMADGGVVPAIKNRRDHINAAEEASVNNTPPPAPKPAPPPKPAETTGVFGRIKKALGFADGGSVDDELARRARAARLPTYQVTELPVETIDYSKVRNPGQTALGRTVESFGSKPPQYVDPARTAGNAVAEARAAAAPATPPAAAQPAPAAQAAKRGFFGRVLNPDVGGFLKSTLGKAGIAGAGIAGAAEGFQTGTGVYEKRFGLKPSDHPLDVAGTRALGVASDVVNAATFGLAGKAANALGFGAQPAAAAQPKGDGLTHTVPQPAAKPEMLYNPGPGSALAALGIDTEDKRGQAVRNTRLAPDQAVPLGDYGFGDQKIFGSASKPGGKIDTFTGKGDAEKKPGTGYVPQGVTLGIKPGDVEQYKADLARRSKLGPMPDSRNTKEYATYQAAAANYDQNVNTAATAAATREAAFGKAAADLQKDKDKAADDRVKYTDQQRKDNEARMSKAVDNYAAGFGPKDEGAQKRYAGKINSILETTQLQLKKSGKNIRFADMDEALLNKYLKGAAVVAKFAEAGENAGEVVPTTVGGVEPKEVSGFGAARRYKAGNPEASWADFISAVFGGKKLSESGGAVIDRAKLTKEELEALKDMQDLFKK